MLRSILLATSLHALVILSSLCMPRRVDASPQQLHSRELLLGQWNATLRTSAHHVAHSPLLSPFVSARKNTPSSDKRQRIPFVLFWKPQFHRTRTIPCLLTFFPNRTFALLGKNDNGDVDATAPSIHGSWRLLTNPYCVTDRFYDQVVLRCSAPSSTQNGSTPAATYHGHCRLTGHFSPMSRRRPTGNFASARLSHCILVQQQQQQQHERTDDGRYGGKPSKRSSIEAQLSASRSIPSPSLVDEECYDATDMELFGY